MSLPRPQATPPKKPSSGCVPLLAVLSVVVVLGVIVALATGAASKGGREAASAVVDGVKMLDDAQHAPGTDALRALGCSEAMVMDMAELAKLAARVDDAAAVPASQVSRMVTCQVEPAAAAPSCDDVAKAYLGAAAAPDKSFSVAVAKRGASNPECSRLYASDGSVLLDLKEGAE